jgi:hypothetical protein
MIGYGLGGFVSTVDGDYALGNAPTYGAAVDIGVIGGMSIELGYRMHDTTIDVTPPGRATYRLYDLTTHYFEIGAKEDFVISDSVRPFVGVTFGGALFAPHVRVDDDFRFVGSLFGGVAYFIARDVSIRAQAKLSTIFLSGSSSILCSSAYGCATAFGGVGLPQFEIALGPTLAF